MKQLIQVIAFMLMLAWVTFFVMPLLERIAVGYSASPHDCGKVNEGMACPAARPAPYQFQHTEIWPS